MHAATYGLDIAKRVFQMYWVDGETGKIVNRRFGRDDLIQFQFLSRRAPGRVALEACGSALWCPWVTALENACFIRTLRDGGCTLKPGIGIAIF